MSKSGKIIVVVAPSGTGKSTLIKKILHDIPEMVWSVSCTTRPMRTGEVDGKDYHFVSVEDFEARLKKGEFIEWAKVHDNYYGTSKVIVDETLNQGLNILMELDVQGCDSLKKIYAKTAQVIFLEPPSMELLEKRLRDRATDSEEVILRRLNNAKSEMTRKNDFDYLMTNDDIDHAYKRFFSIVSEILGR